MPLTDTRIRAAKADTRPYKLGDADGLTLLVQPTGSKLWRFRYRFLGKEKMLSLGTYPEVSLLDARKRRNAARKLVASGIDPKLLRGYEKGKQLGRPDDPWFRVEVELHNKGRVIPWAILTEPGPFLAGAYPCLAFLHAEQSRIATQRRALELTYDRMERWLSDAGGKALNAMMTAHHGDALGVIDRLVKEGFPKRLTGFSADDLNQLGDVP